MPRPLLNKAQKLECARVADIFQEVDEEIRRDKAKGLWRKYGVYVIIVCVGIVFGTASRVIWREYKATQQSEESSRYIVAKKLLDKGYDAYLYLHTKFDGNCNINKIETNETEDTEGTSYSGESDAADDDF